MVKLASIFIIFISFYWKLTIQDLPCSCTLPFNWNSFSIVLREELVLAKGNCYTFLNRSTSHFGCHCHTTSNFNLSVAVCSFWTLYHKKTINQPYPDNIDERANVVRRKFLKFADNFDTLKQKKKKIFFF